MILENDLKIHVFLAALESAVEAAAAVAALVVSRIKDSAQINFSLIPVVLDLLDSIQRFSLPV